jgi:hypothetical protein
MAPFNPFTAYVVKAVFPNNTYIGCAFVYALQQGLLWAFSIPGKPGRRSKAIGAMLRAGAGLNAKFIGNKADIVNKGAWAFLQSHWLKTK